MTAERLSELVDARGRWPDPSMPGSINDYTALLPKLRHYTQSKGLVLYLPWSGLVIVPFELTANGANAVVVRGDATYRVGSYNLWIDSGQLETSPEVRID
jgi:hypothetical protein